MSISEAILKGNTSLGIEFGSTRIKAVLVDDTHAPIASGGHEWENRFENGVWTYSMDDVWNGVQSCYADLVRDIKEKYGVVPETFGAIGVSAMMHGYLPFDKDGKQLAEFRTWRNTSTGEAAGKLTELFRFNIPLRWSISHLEQSILNGEEHVRDIDFFTTLAGYVHWKLTGERVLSVGDASGMFPIDSTINDYDADMLEKFDVLNADKGFAWKLADILPKVLVAGDNAGYLTEAGAKLLDPTGTLKAGAPMCPPEGDAGTGMTATNSVAVRTGNVSAGTSVFGMFVLEKALSDVYPEIDMVTTPTGKPVAMVHCNNCTTDLNAWVSIFNEFARMIGVELSGNDLYGGLYRKALEGDKECGGLLAYNYYSGEHNTGLTEGRPLFVRKPDSSFTLANFMRAHLYSSLSTLKYGYDILQNKEHVRLDHIYGHGGLFKTKGVGQSILAAALNAPVAVMATAGEGGAWGIALQAAYMKNRAEGETFEAYLVDRVFNGDMGEEMTPNPDDVAGFNAFIDRYIKGLAIEKTAVTAMR